MIEFQGINIIDIAPLPDGFWQTAPKPKFLLSDDELIARMDRAFGYGLPTIAELRAREQTPAAVCGGGASIADAATISALHRLRLRGARIFACNKTHDFLWSKGVPVDYAVLCDPQEIVATYIGVPRRRTRYLIASQCHDAVFEKLRGFECYLWHAVSSSAGDKTELARKEHELFNVKHAGREWFRVPGGTTVGMRTMFMADGLNHRPIHLFGFDSSFRRGRLYGYDKPNANLEACVYSVKTGGSDVTFTSNLAMSRQADEFRRRLYELEDRGYPVSDMIRVHGTGAIPYQAALMGLHADDACNADPARAIE